jgi:hypothetical protein
MAYIDKITEDKIKSAAGIVDVLSDFLTLKKKGVNYLALCPFHDDKHLGSFVVSPKHNCYKCFKCDAKGGPVDYLVRHEGLSYPDALRYLAKKYSIPIDDPLDDARYQHIKPATPRSAEPDKPLEMLTLTRDVLKRTLPMANEKNIFVYWLQHLPWDTQEERDRLRDVLWLYCVGGWTDGRVCFWQIDEQGRPHGGKLMRYGNDGKRDKTENPGWMHNQKGIREQLDLEHNEYRATLFGLHLLNRYPQATINIVESEKTALICANAYGHPERSLWMACGGLKFLKLESLQPLIDQGRRVWLWPDKDGVEDWKQKCEHLLSDRVSITTRYLEENWVPDDGEKADVADIILRLIKRPDTYVKRTTQKVEVPTDLNNIKAWVETHGDEPFIDPEELANSQVAMWRETLRQRYNFNKRHNGGTIHTTD